MAHKRSLDTPAVIITVRNESRTIDALLHRLVRQTLTPSEVIIADGASSDSTFRRLLAWQKRDLPFALHVLAIPGNRSRGRNAAIAASSAEWVAITDAGCVPDPDWLAELVTQQRVSQAQVVAGYYRAAHSNSALAQAMVPFALVMPDQLNPDDFLPATRSMLVQREIWEQLGGFDESLSDNEDYAFAQQLDTHHINRSFTSRAVVAWRPRENWRAIAIMFFRFARGDVRAGIWRTRVQALFARYLLLMGVGGLVWWWRTWWLAILLLGWLSVYSFYAVYKHRRHVPRTAWYWLPILQLTADVFVMTGSLAGWWQRHRAGAANRPKRQ